MAEGNAKKQNEKRNNMDNDYFVVMDSHVCVICFTFYKLILKNMSLMESIEILGQLFLAAVLGALIGIERLRIHKATGVRTLALIAVGSCLFTILSWEGLKYSGLDFEPTRIAAQIVTGVGFLGAGVIIFDQHKIQGLTSAAGLWVTAAIGMAVGFGHYWIAIFGTLIVLFFLLVIGKLDLDNKFKGAKK